MLYVKIYIINNFNSNPGHNQSMPWYTTFFIFGCQSSESGFNVVSFMKLATDAEYWILLNLLIFKIKNSFKTQLFLEFKNGFTFPSPTPSIKLHVRWPWVIRLKVSSKVLSNCIMSLNTNCDWRFKKLNRAKN